MADPNASLIEAARRRQWFHPRLSGPLMDAFPTTTRASPRCCDGRVVAEDARIARPEGEEHGIRMPSADLDRAGVVAALGISEDDRL